MRIEDSAMIPGAKFIALDPLTDERGEFFAAYSTASHGFSTPAGEAMTFVEDDFSISRRHTLRGLHADDHTWKLLQCVVGEVQLVLLDIRPDSDAHLRWESLTLSDGERRQVLVPAGCAVGHLVLSEFSVLWYKQSHHYAGAGNQVTVRWNDPKLGIPWSVAEPILSERDAGAPLL